MEKIAAVTPCGKIEGLTDGKTCRYLGVRYATAERFEKPKRVESWQGVYDATELGDCCIQYRTYFDEGLKKNTLWYDEFRRGLTFTYSEDCLNLNVYAPICDDASPEKSRPVILFVHGGSFIKGSNSERAFDGTAYASRGAILVTVNYRLNVFGYYADDKRCNLALYDIVCALEWVKANVSAFGGDPERITLMGQSAGAMSVQALILNDEIKKSVVGAIMLSGGGLTSGLYAPHSLGRARKFFAAVRKDLENGGDDIFTAEPEKVFMAWKRVSGKKPISSMLATMPCFDDRLVKKSDYSGLKHTSVLPAIVSVTKDDLQPRGYLVGSAEKYSKKSMAPVWLLAFDRPLPGDDKGAWHSSDLWYVFGTLSKHPWRKFEPHDFDLSNELVDRFVGFASCGDPNFDGNGKQFDTIWQKGTWLIKA